MKKAFLRAGMAVLMLTCVLFTQFNVYADGSAYIDVPEGTQTGSSVTVYLNVQCDSNIGTISCNFSYDESILQFVSSDYASGGGGELVIPAAFPDSPSSQMTLDFNFNAIAEGDALVSVSGYVFDAEGTVIADLSAESSVTVGGTLPPEPDEPDEPEETTTTTTAAESSVPEESKPIETTETVIETEAPAETQITEDAEPVQADVVSSAKSSSSSKAENERTDLAKKLTVPLLIILAVLILALVIITVWIKNRMKKK
ncbi:MAG: hypothetical protein IJ571_02515 [Ruminococcus sp.]|nr:hypothetical protein [Ruminococcus sp.]